MRAATDLASCLDRKICPVEDFYHSRALECEGTEPKRKSLQSSFSGHMACFSWGKQYSGLGVFSKLLAGEESVKLHGRR